MEFVIENISQDEIRILESGRFDYHLMNETTAVIEGDVVDYALALRALRRNQRRSGKTDSESDRVTYAHSSVCCTDLNKPDVHENESLEMQKRNNQLSENEEMAILLHGSLCNRDHNDQCSWFYEMSGTSHDWTRFAHNRYLKMANKLLDKGIHLETLSTVLDCIR